MDDGINEKQIGNGQEEEKYRKSAHRVRVLQYTRWGSRATTERMTNKYTLNKYLVDGAVRSNGIKELVLLSAASHPDKCQRRRRDVYMMRN